MAASLLNPNEAAVVAGVTLRDVNRVIDERILPERFYSVGDGRRVHLAACPLVGFYFRAARALTAEERLALISRFSERITASLLIRPFEGWADADWRVDDDFLSVSLSPFVADADTRGRRLAAARARVVEDPAILGGAPVVKGTRVPVHDLAASVATGLSRERILSAYPGLDAETLDLAVLYAEAHPARGRPRRAVGRGAGCSPDG
ncbi:DUF433 domain-containing protein [Roseospira visakhapatnamensis]|uniref:Uncharacterized protein (DUF433 family) n=1 Tax=Roseospira visakhapatnamensis TaxID=390880 RepID=A0A7W6WB31_9PROT|nr:DUF433 domain-containing protein [Roseospira visakhapatnamensis]MBB4267875.1 uncharacterized protein (DUF433 family) [Roseospira visakhapatnamensis]